MRFTRPQNITKQVGTFCVDAGLCMIGDPCYWHNDELDATSQSSLEKVLGGKDWPTFCNALSTKSFYTTGAVDLDGLGVVVQTGIGDGLYPVYATYDSEGIISEVTIKFMEWAEEEEEDGDDPDGDDPNPPLEPYFPEMDEDPYPLV